MAGAGPTVRLTFAGDPTDLEKAFKRVGTAADGMGRDVESSSDRVRQAGRDFDGLADRAGDVDTRAMGFRDTITGLQDSFKGLTDDSLSLDERLLTLGMGVGDLASGFENFLIPQAKNATEWVRDKLPFGLGRSKSAVEGLADSADDAASSVGDGGGRKGRKGLKVALGALAATAAAFVLSGALSELDKLNQEAAGGVENLDAQGRAVHRLGGELDALLSLDFGYFVDTVKERWGELTGSWESSTGLIRDSTEELGWIAERLPGPFGKAFSMISNIVGQFSGEAGQKASTEFSAMATNAGRWASETLRSVGSYLSTLPGRVRGWLGGLGGQMVGVGRDIMNGIGAGLSAGWGWLRDRVSSIARSLLSTAKAVLGIRSPSRRFADEVGRMIPRGVEVGVEADTGGAVRAVEDMAGDLAGVALPSLDMRSVAAADGTSRGAVAATGSRSVTFHGNVSDPLARVIQQMIRTGQIQIA